MARTLGVCMIVRDEADRLERSLGSVRGLVDEIVVVDTGSVDGSPAVARALGARVVHAAWTDDFSAARNRSLEASTADVRIVLDADEWIEEGRAEFAALRDLADGEAAALVQRSTLTTPAGETTSDTRLVRVLPRGARYVGRIHEQPTGHGAVRETGIVLGHDGYAPAATVRKRGRNERLLRMDLADGVSDPYTWYQLGKDLEVQRRVDEAADAYERALTTGGDGTSDAEPWRHDLLVRALYCLGRAGRQDATTALFARAEREFPDSPDVRFVMADVLLEWALLAPEAAHAIHPMIGELLRRCLEIGEHPELLGTVRGRGSVLARRNLDAWEQAGRELRGARTA